MSLVCPSDGRYTHAMDGPNDPLPWLLLVHQLPSEPSRARVKTWRRLQSVGAVAVKNSVYVLPNTDETREDFEWIRAEIVAQGGEATVFAAEATDEPSSAEIRKALESARESDWQELRESCQAVLASHRPKAPLEEDSLGDVQRQLRTLRSRVSRIERIDHFRVSGRRQALVALRQLEKLVVPNDEADRPPPRRRVEEYRERVWVTRPRPGVDRMASAWLIRRFIDPDARFRFSRRIPQRGDSVAAIPFDMFGVELGHRGEMVTFETLLQDFGLRDPALSRIARIVHDLDVNAEPFRDVEAETVERLVAGLRESFGDDDSLLSHGMAMFEALYASFSSPTPRSASPSSAGDLHDDNPVQDDSY